MKRLILLSALLIFACSSDDETNEPCPLQPFLQTDDVTSIVLNEASIEDLYYGNITYKATLNGNINNIAIGDSCEILSITSQGFVYDTTIQPTLADNTVEVNGQLVSTELNGLSSETIYYARTFITNPLGTFYGNEISFLYTRRFSIFVGVDWC